MSVRGEFARSNDQHGKTVKDRLMLNGIEDKAWIPAFSTSSWRPWLQSYGLKSREETATCFHEEYVLHGYRAVPSTFAYCVKSIFHPTNETLNVWTHLVPFFFMLYRHVDFATTNLSERGYTDTLFGPYWLLVIGVLLTLLGSSCAHMFNCYTHGAREACFCCDYGCIAVHSIGLTCCFTFYICPYTCMFSWSGLFLLSYPLIIFGNVVTLPLVCASRLPHVPNSLRFIPYVVMYILLTLPCMYKYQTPSSTSNYETCNLAMNDEAKVDFYMITCFMAISAIVKGLRWPERLFPGWFDIVGQSHQIFHVMMAIVLYYENKLIERTLLEILTKIKEENLRFEDLNMTRFTVVQYPLANVFLVVLITSVFSTTLCRRQNRLQASISYQTDVKKSS